MQLWKESAPMNMNEEQRDELETLINNHARVYARDEHALPEDVAIFNFVARIVSGAYEKGKLDGENEQQTLTNQHNLARGKP